jgi:hypothetical protein
MIITFNLTWLTTLTPFLLIGFGFVGKATYLLNNKDLTVYVYDITPSLCIPLDIVLEDVLIEING